MSAPGLTIYNGHSNKNENKNVPKNILLAENVNNYSASNEFSDKFSKQYFCCCTHKVLIIICCNLVSEFFFLHLLLLIFQLWILITFNYMLAMLSHEIWYNWCLQVFVMPTRIITNTFWFCFYFCFTHLITTNAGWKRNSLKSNLLKCLKFILTVYHMLVNW